MENPCRSIDLQNLDHTLNQLYGRIFAVLEQTSGNAHDQALILKKEESEPEVALRIIAQI